jgi:hypothetical protein
MGSGKRGGKRKGAGRKAGALSKKTRHIAEIAIDEGITPLEVMLKEMRLAAATGDSELALEAAKAAAPYIHPKLSSVQVTGKDGAAVQIERIERVIVDPQNSDP